jgi:hypothetical protein
VRVSPSPPDDLFSIIDVLRTLPHVTSATPDNLLPLDTLGADLDPSVDHGSNVTQMQPDTGSAKPEVAPERIAAFHESANAVTVLRFNCTLSFSDAEKGEVRCGVPGAAIASAERSVIVPWHSEYANWLASNLVRDTASETWRFRAGIQNLLAQPIGTLDGTTALGSRVVVSHGPIATRGTGDVWITNADGVADFTAPNQPYFDHPWIVQPLQVSPYRQFELHVPNTVTEVTLGIAIPTKFPAMSSVAALPPDTTPAWFDDDTSWVRGGMLPDGFLRNIVSVLFERGTYLADRQAAVALVGGHVVGGTRFSGGDGYYYLFIRDDGTGAQLREAARKLAALPQVEVAVLQMRAYPADRARSN